MANHIVSIVLSRPEELDGGFLGFEEGLDIIFRNNFGNMIGNPLNIG